MELSPESVRHDPLDDLLVSGRAVPAWWREKSPEDGFIALRCRLEFTQDELAERAGLTQARLSHLESGADARLGTWRRAYAAMGFDLVLLPVSPRTARELERLAEDGRPEGSWRRQRARPRRHKSTVAANPTTAEV